MVAMHSNNTLKTLAYVLILATGLILVGKFHLLLEYGEQRYDWRKHLNGNNYLFSNTLLYVPKSGQHWFAGVDYSRENTRDKDNAYQRVGGRLGWGQEWHGEYQAESRFHMLNVIIKRLISLTFVRKNREYASTLTLWHRDLYFWGITPKITWSYQKVKSKSSFLWLRQKPCILRNE